MKKCVNVHSSITFQVIEALHDNPYLSKEAQKLEQIKNSLDLETTAV